jgi:hypothetical protein
MSKKTIFLFALTGVFLVALAVARYAIEFNPEFIKAYGIQPFFLEIGRFTAFFCSVFFGFAALLAVKKDMEK